jgi:hypothetical protein
MFNQDWTACREFVAFGTDATYDTAILRSLTVHIESGLSTETGGIVLHRSSIYLDTSAVDCHSVQRTALNIAADDLLLNGILGVATTGIPAGIIAPNLPARTCETVEVTVVTADVIALSSAATLGDEHTYIGQTRSGKEIVVKRDVLEAKVRSLCAVVIKIH